jgi:hypothetical protein
MAMGAYYKEDGHDLVVAGPVLLALHLDRG